MRESAIFALDIGTRSVVGVVMEENTNGLEIVASYSHEHKHQAMIDGQIHDIGQVAQTVQLVKENLEGKLGYDLKQVAVAAAGRALKTLRTKVSVEAENLDQIKYDDVLRLELQGIQKAQEELLAKEHESSDVVYNCVGYSVVCYELDGDKIKNLIGQKGKEIAVDVIATFLPRVVVDSLFAVLQKAGLEMMSLTLEPIAASTVVVPESMRQLSIALVDVGAGTSDIAVTADGAISGYGMVPMAGDEITEKISHTYLVDFYQAENIKRQLMQVEELEIEDVLGNIQKYNSSEIIETIDETVSELAQKICDKILYVNQKAPQAVICIGGGSLTPLLKEKIADNLGLTQQRVAIRGRNAITDVAGAQNLAGPDAVTPIGIAVTAHENKGLGFAKVAVNGKEIRLFEVNKGTVGDALLAAGVNMKRLVPRLGLALTVTVNGKLEIIRGNRGKPAVVMLNGNEVSIDTPIRHNDVIEFNPAEDGEDARGIVADVLPDLLSFKVGLNNKVFEVIPQIMMNDEPVNLDSEIIDNAKIIYHLPRTVAEVLEEAGYNKDLTQCDIFVNSQKVDLLYELEEGDEISIIHPTVSKEEKNSAFDNVSMYTAAAKETDALDDVLDEVDSEKVETKGLGNQVNIGTRIGTSAESEALGIGNDMRNEIGTEIRNENLGAGSKTDEEIQEKLEFASKASEQIGFSTLVYVNDKQVIIPRENIILTDVLTKIDFPFTPPKPGSRLIMKVNEGPGEFTTPLKSGDRVVLEWV